MRVSVSALFLCLASLLVLSSAWAVPEYKLGPGDQIEVKVLRHEDFSGKHYIPNDGIIDIPSVGRVQASGKTLAELRTNLISLFKTRLLEPEVSITLTEPRIQPIYVLGAVAAAGMFDSKPGWRIAEALAAAGGVLKTVKKDDCKAVVLRAATGEKLTVMLADALSASPEANLLLESGDVITIESPDRFFVFIRGQVGSPGMKELFKGSDTLAELLANSGGVGLTAAIKKVAITHNDGSCETVDISETMPNGSKASSMRLQAGEVVFVPEAIIPHVAVLGWVNSPGYFPIPANRQLTTSEAIALANGPIRGSANVGSVVLTRNVNGVAQTTTINLSKYYKNGDLTYNPLLQDGDMIYLVKDRSPNVGVVTNALSTILFMRNVLGF